MRHRVLGLAGQISEIERRPKCSARQIRPRRIQRQPHPGRGLDALAHDQARRQRRRRQLNMAAGLAAARLLGVEQLAA